MAALTITAGAALYFIKQKFKTMAHNINFNEQTQQHSFFSVKEKAWHGLGQIVQDYPTSKEALQFAGLDFENVQRILSRCINYSDSQYWGGR